MSYIGIVHRKDTDTGVTARAKVVTPNKRKAAIKDYKITVKAETISDYTCCVIDNSTARQRISNSVILDDVTENIGDYFITAGVNQTETKYKIVGDTLRACIDDNGNFISAPKLGMGAAIGQIELTTTKGDAEVKSYIQVTVKEVTPERILAVEITEEKLWNTIRGGNRPYNQQGNMQIYKDLNLTNSMSSAYLDASKSIALAYEITDSLGATYNAISGRINPSTGAYVTDKIPTYTEAWQMFVDLSNDTTKIAPDSIGNNFRYYKLKGLKIKITATLDGASSVKSIDCATMSKFMTGEEVIAQVTNLNMLTAKYYENAIAQYTIAFVQDGTTPTLVPLTVHVSDNPMFRIPYTGVASGDGYNFQIFGSITPDFAFKVVPWGETSAIAPETLGKIFESSDLDQVFAVDGAVNSNFTVGYINSTEFESVAPQVVYLKGTLKCTLYPNAAGATIQQSQTVEKVFMAKIRLEVPSVTPGT
jgi:hypothetical protein